MANHMMDVHLTTMTGQQESENGYKGLNGDILVWNDVLGSAFELSSMGIRVDEDTLRRQVAITGDEDRLQLSGTKPC